MPFQKVSGIIRAAAIVALLLVFPASALATGYAQSQMFTRKVFGYGMYVVRGMASPESLVSAFYLQNIQPDINNWPASEPLWRWTEFDWEFVPNTASTTPTGLVEMDGPLPTPTMTPTYYPQDAGNGAPGVANGYRTDVNWAQGIINLWNSNKANTPITIAKSQNAWDALAAATHPTSDTPPFGWNSGKGPIAINSWPMWGTQPQATTDQLQKAVSINFIRWPYGAQTRTYTAPDKTVKASNFVPSINTGPFPPTDKSQFMPSAAGLGNQVFVWAKDKTNFDPYTQFYDYTIVWTPTKVAFYIGVPGGGLDIAKATPVMVMDAKDYPSAGQIGPNDPNCMEQWYSFDWRKGTPMGLVHWSLQLWHSDGWGGVVPPGFTQGDMYVKNVSFYPLIKGKPGDQQGDFNTTVGGDGVFYQDFSSMTASNWRAEVSKHWWTLAGWSPDNNTDIYHAGLVSWVSTTPAINDKGGALKLSLTPRANEPKVDYYLLGPAGPVDTNGRPVHDPKKYIMATITGMPSKAVTNACATSYLTDPFWVYGAKDSDPVTAIVTVMNPVKDAPVGTAQVQFGDYPSFTVISCSPPNLFQNVGKVQKLNVISPMPVK